MSYYFLALLMIFSVLSEDVFAEGTNATNNSTTEEAEVKMKYSWYSTIGEMQNMTKLEIKMLNMLKQQLSMGRIQIKMMKGIIGKIRKIGKNVLNKNILSASTNTEIKTRYTQNWRRLGGLSSFLFGHSFVSHFEEKQAMLPSDDDYAVVVQSLWELQKLYNMNSTELAEGYIFGRFSGRRLSTNGCGIMAMFTCSHSTKLCREWTDIAKARLAAGDTSQFKHQDLVTMMENRYTEALFDEICAESLHDKPISNSLQCHMWTNFGHPWLVLQPVAMEMLSTSPPVARFFNIIPDEDIEILKSLALQDLKSAKTFAKEKQIETDSHRITHNTWLTKNNNTILQRLDNFISAITGLKVAKSAEKLQVANYGILGRYYGHVDQMNFSPKKEMHLINRKATFMIYLSDVEYGGSTVFLHSKLAAKPIKGSALFWYNIDNSGASDDRTTHGSCPVLVGDKWVGNKWIWETTREKCKVTEYLGRIH